MQETYPQESILCTWLNWVDKYFVVGADGIHLREVPVERVRAPRFVGDSGNWQEETPKSTFAEQVSGMS